MGPIPCQKVMSNGFQVYKRIVVFFKFKQFYCALLMGMVHNKEVHGVILKKKWKQLKSLQKFVWLSTCSPEAASSTEHMLNLVHLSHGSAEAEGQVPTFCKMPLQPDPDLQLLSSQAGSTGNSVLTRFLLFLPRKKEMTTSSLFPSHWVLQSVKQPQLPGRRVCAKAIWALWFVHHIPWESGRSILLLYSVQGCSPSAQPFW